MPCKNCLGASAECTFWAPVMKRGPRPRCDDYKSSMRLSFADRSDRQMIRGTVGRVQINIFLPPIDALETRQTSTHRVDCPARMTPFKRPLHRLSNGQAYTMYLNRKPRRIQGRSRQQSRIYRSPHLLACQPNMRLSSLWAVVRASQLGVLLTGRWRDRA